MYSLCLKYCSSSTFKGVIDFLRAKWEKNNNKNCNLGLCAITKYYDELLIQSQQKQLEGQGVTFFYKRSLKYLK